VHAFPLRLRTQVIGAMNVFGTSTGGDFTPGSVSIMQALADVAAIGLLQERAVRRGDVLAQQLQNALNSRIVIEQAKGAIAQVRGISTDEAFVLIRAYARNHNRRLTDLAYAIVTDPAAIPGLHTP
jgi:GAF domain-containing protein